MGGARALIASLGASISLVAGAALSLLVVSFVFAYDGLSGRTYDGATANAQVVVADPRATTSKARQGSSTSAAAVVIAAPASRPATERRPAQRDDEPAPAGDVDVRRPATARTFVAAPPAAPVTSGTDPQSPSAGEGVRDLGDSVTSTVDDGGSAASGAAAPLGPPVSETVQEVINLLNALIQGATGGLAGALDGTAKR